MSTTPDASADGANEGQLSARFDTCLLLSLVLIMLRCPSIWWVVGTMRALAIAGIVLPGVRASAKAWLFAAAVLGAGTLFNWPRSDNHWYLMTYWTLAVAAALSSGEDRRYGVLATNARWLLVAVMGFAVLQKGISWTYLSGAFFEFSLLTDIRFSGFVAAITDLTPADLEENRKLLEATMQSQAVEATPRELAWSPGVRAIALFTTWWTILIETAIAVAFAFPPRGRFAIARHLLLGVFAITAYVVSPVPGFGCLLMLLGASQSLDERPQVFYGYVAMFAVVEFFAAATKGGWAVVNLVLSAL